MTLRFERGYICCGCGRRFRASDVFAVYKKSCLCPECRKRLEPHTPSGFMLVRGMDDPLMILYKYKGLYREIFLKFKFGGEYAYGHLLGMAAAKQLGERELFGGYDILVPVPLSKQRLNERGYNQTEIMAEYIAEAAGLPISNALKRLRHSAPQSVMLRAERADNVAGAFSASADVVGKRVLLIDDVFTTGSTARECAAALRKAGAEQVGVICAAENRG